MVYEEETDLTNNGNKEGEISLTSSNHDSPNESNLSSEEGGLLPIKGILKTTSSFQSGNIKRNIRWDEDKISKMETQRGTRMKIDEPKTPYVQPFKYENLSESEKAELGEYMVEPEQCGLYSATESDPYEENLQSGEEEQEESSHEDEWNEESDEDSYSEKLVRGASKELTTNNFEQMRARHYDVSKIFANKQKKAKANGPQDTSVNSHNNEDSSTSNNENSSTSNKKT